MIVETLQEKWFRSGIDQSDTVLIHSNIMRLLIESKRAGLSIDPHEILNSFLDAVGTKGTLLFPLFNFDFAKGISFDIRNTPSHMGALTEVARLHKDAVRTGHPIYSFAAIGYRSKEFEHVDNESGYADDSPFGILRRMNGKVAALDLDDQSCMTFYHHVEEMKRVDYRYFKSFKGNYTDFNGITKEKSYQLFVRDLERGVKTHINPTGELMWKEGLYKGYRPNEDTGLRVIKSQDMFEFIGNLIDNSKALGALYILEK